MANILVIEDEMNFRKTLELFLKKDGHSVGSAEDASEAMTLLSQMAFDVVITDIFMPDITGVDLLIEIKKSSPHVPVIMMTGAPNLVTITESLRAGAFDYFTKPVSKEMVLKTVRKAVQFKYLGDEKRRLEMENKKQLKNLEQQVEDRTNRLRSERDKLQGVINGFGSGMSIVSNDYIIEYQNIGTEEIYPDATGKTCYSTYHKLSVPCDFCLMKEAVETKNILQTEKNLENGSTYEITFSPFLDISGEYKTIILMRDVTEKKMFREEALRSSQLAALGELAAGVAHEINNPVTGIICLAEVLSDKFQELGGDREIPERILIEGERIGGIVKNLLSFARDDKEEKAPANIKEALELSINLTEKQILKDGINLTISIPDDLPKVKMNVQEIQQVLLNITSNARYALNQKFSDYADNKILIITGELVEVDNVDFVRIVFYDRGLGISKNNIKKISEPFYSTKPQGEGTGLGLSISHGIIVNHDGKLWFESNEGEYTKAVIDLPVNREQLQVQT